jgi:hypothetical protein
MATHGNTPHEPDKSITTPKKGGLLLTLKGSLISHGALRALRESRFSRDTQEIAYLAPLGRAITLRGIVYGKGSQRKKEECILFSLKTFSHKTVSNHPVVTLLRGPCPPSAALQALAGGSAGSSTPDCRSAGERYKTLSADCFSCEDSDLQRALFYGWEYMDSGVVCQ